MPGQAGMGILHFLMEFHIFQLFKLAILEINADLRCLGGTWVWEDQPCVLINPEHSLDGSRTVEGLSMEANWLSSIITMYALCFLCKTHAGNQNERWISEYLIIAYITLVIMPIIN